MTSDIYTHRWPVPDDVSTQRTGVYLLHGVGEHGGRYAPLASRLAAQGFPVGAHDHPGHGRSGGRRGVIDPPGSLVVQAAIQVEEFARETGTPPILFGHSMGGATAAELVLQHGLNVSGLMLSAPAFVPFMSTLNRVQLKTLKLIAPTFSRELPYDPSVLTSDPEQQQAALDDRLLHGTKSASLIAWLVESGHRSLSLAGRINQPTLVMIAGADTVVDPDAGRRFVAEAPAELVNGIVYEGYRHELLNEKPAMRERVMDDIDRWLKQFTA